ncbi:hypothetical protein evm_004859 [Chilo suppressalis]|nr:hypothetical protein evm_004859 [Chilo suppressalis]
MYVVRLYEDRTDRDELLQNRTNTFPRNRTRRNDWVLIIRHCRGDNNWNPSPASTVCSAHFEDLDFKNTAKGLRCLVPYAIPKRLLSNSPETQTQSTSPPIPQISTNIRGIENNPQPTSSSSTKLSLLQVPAITDEFKLSGYCRLCAISICDDMLLNVQSDSSMKNLVVNMSKRLNTNIDFSQKHLPTTICSICVKSLYTAYDFVVAIDLAQMTLNKISVQEDNSQVPVNLNHDNNGDFSNTSVQQRNNKSEACDSDQPWLHVSSETTYPQQLSSKIEAVPRPHSVELSQNIPFMLDTPRKRRLKDNLHKKKLIIDLQKKKLKRLNQKLLTHRKTLPKWYGHIKGEPGFTEESFQALKSKAGVSQQHRLYVLLCFDEVAIRPQKLWDGKKNIGFCRYGAGVEEGAALASSSTGFLTCRSSSQIINSTIPYHRHDEMNILAFDSLNFLEKCNTNLDDFIKQLEYEKFNDCRRSDGRPPTVSYFCYEVVTDVLPPDAVDRRCINIMPPVLSKMPKIALVAATIAATSPLQKEQRKKRSEWAKFYYRNRE